MPAIADKLQMPVDGLSTLAKGKMPETGECRRIGERCRIPANAKQSNLAAPPDLHATTNPPRLHLGLLVTAVLWSFWTLNMVS
jgi:hypothetical protein